MEATTGKPAAPPDPEPAPEAQPASEEEPSQDTQPPPEERLAGQEPAPPAPSPAPSPAPQPAAGAGGPADGVFEGGGVKGIAFAGAIQAAEEVAGVTEWISLAGTSAGAIVAGLLAVGYNADGLRQILDQAQYPKFADTGPLGLKVGGGINALFRMRGLAPGKYFTTWYADCLAKSPLAKKLGKTELTFKDVSRDIGPKEKYPELDDVQYERARYRLHVITSDVTAGRMVVLPDNLPDYCDANGKQLDKDSFLLVDAVRMSMSYPFLFEPVVLYQKSSKGELRPYYMVDGGLLSNFPIWLFDTPGKPTRPTWGFRLHGGTSDTEGLPYVDIPRPFWALPLLKAMFSAATEAWDRKQLSEAAQSRTVSLPTHSVQTTNFNLSKTEAKNLFSWGEDAATRFFKAKPQQTYINSFGKKLVP